MTRSGAILWAVLLCCPLAGVIPAASADASEETSASVLARRVIKLFDFDERPENLEPTPQFWEKIMGPHYVNGFLDESQGKPSPCFKLQLDGGDLGYVFRELQIEAFPGSDHKIIAYVKTERLKHARGFIEAFYMARFGKVLKQTRRYSRLIGPTRPGDPDWIPVEIDLPFTNSEGRYIGLGIWLVQQDNIPEQLPQTERYGTDIDAAMYVDNITVIRLPRLRLALAGDRFVYDTTEPVIVQASVADPSGADLRARIAVIDLATDRYVSFPHPVKLLPRLEEILQGHKEPPALIDRNIGQLKPGAYQILLQIIAGNDVIITKQCQIAVLVPPRSTKRRRIGKFGIDLHRETDIDVAGISEFLDRLRVAWTIVPIWRSDMNASSGGSDQWPGDLLAVKLNRAGISVIGGYVGTPGNMVERTGLLSPSIWDLFASDRSGWETELTLVLLRHADRIDRWVFDQKSGVWQMPDRKIGSVLESLKDRFSEFQGQFDLIPAWPAMIDPPSDPLTGGYLIQLPTELLWRGYGDYFQNWSHLTDDVWLILPRPDLDRFDLTSSLLGFCSRVLYAKRYGFDRIGVSGLWRRKEDAGRQTLEPSGAFPVYGNIIHRLAGLRYVGEVRLTGQISGWLFSGAQRAVMVILTDESGVLSSKVLLGDNLQAFDMWGRRLPITMGQDDWELTYDRLAFIEGIDGGLAKFVASVRFDPPLLASRFGTHEVQLVFKNAYPQTLTGRVRLNAGHNWHFDPPGMPFAIRPGQEYAMAMKVRYPVNEPVGQKLVTARFTLEARREIKLSLLVPLNLGLSDLKMEVSWSVRAGRVVISQKVRNVGRAWVDLSAYLRAPDRLNMQRQIRQLGPGQTVVKEYTLGSLRDLHGRSVRVGFSEVRGDRMVNKIIKIE